MGGFWFDAKFSLGYFTFTCCYFSRDFNALNLTRKMLDFFFFDSVKHSFQDYFIHIETSQSVGGAIREYQGKTT